MKYRQSALVEIFEAGDRFLVFVTESDLHALAAFAEANSLLRPLSANATQYRLIRQYSPRMLRFPRSPLVVYTSDGSSLILTARSHDIPKRSVWCGHDHSLGGTAIRVTRCGVNPKKRYLFNALQ
jgi:hypothetical protein